MMKSVMPPNQRKRWFWFAAPTLLIAVLIVGFTVPSDDPFFAIKKNFTLFGEIYERISIDYVDEIDPEQLMRTGIDAMLQSLDPYTVFFDEAFNEDINIMATGKQGGVGLDVGIRNQRLTVTGLSDGYSGAAQGVRIGDIITHIDAQPVSDLSPRDVSTLLAGDPGTPVSLRITRTGETMPLEFVLTRSPVRIKNVTHAGFVDDDSTRGLGYIRLQQFGRGADQEVWQALKTMKDSGHLKGLILDLRGNGGGLLSGAINIAGNFLPQGSLIVSTRGRQEAMEQAYRSRMPPLTLDLPLVVLVNGSSASASEIVAGAVQDMDRGLVVGERTFGKGLVQQVRPVAYNTSMKLTTAKYYTPSGRCIQAINYIQSGADRYDEQVPDSLRTAFKTQGGRTVLDGAGIEPDFLVSAGRKSELEEALLRKSLFFFFANEFAQQQAQITPDFRVTDQVLADFHQWLMGQDFTYRTRAEEELENLLAELNAAGYEQTEERAMDLRERIAEEKRNDFSRYADRLREPLRQEILARYFEESVQITASFDTDPVMQTALSLLQDTAWYQRLLQPQ